MRGVGYGACLAVVAAAGCARPESSDSAPLLGRWQMVQGTQAVFQFLEGGQLIGAMDGEQEFGTFEVYGESVLLMIDGDTLLADFAVTQDTLHLTMLGDSQRLVGVRIGS